MSVYGRLLNSYQPSQAPTRDSTTDGPASAISQHRCPGTGQVRVLSANSCVRPVSFRIQTVRQQLILTGLKVVHVLRAKLLLGGTHCEYRRTGSRKTSQEASYKKHHCSK